MIIEPTFLVDDPHIVNGLIEGRLKRFGGVIREAATGKIVRHLLESPSYTNYMMTFAGNPLLGVGKLFVDAAGHAATAHKLHRISRQIEQVHNMLNPILGFSQIAAGAGVLNVGISAIGFAYMGYKLHQIQNSLGTLQNTIEAGFQSIDDRLSTLSGQLAYLHLIVQDNRDKQIQLEHSITQLFRYHLVSTLAELQAELIDQKRFPNTSIQTPLKVASKVRMVMSDSVHQIKPTLDPGQMLLTDVSTQGWAVSTAVESNLLMQDGRFDEAIDLLKMEVPKFNRHAEEWTQALLEDERPELETAYRFSAPPLLPYISPERIERIAYRSIKDRDLSLEKIQDKKDNVAVEFEMPYADQFDRQWVYQQVGVAEYLDTLSELSARLETLQDFAELCQKHDLSSSLDLLNQPMDNTDKQTWYLLPHD